MSVMFTESADCANVLFNWWEPAAAAARLQAALLC